MSRRRVMLLLLLVLLLGGGALVLMRSREEVRAPALERPFAAHEPPTAPQSRLQVESVPDRTSATEIPAAPAPAPEPPADLRALGAGRGWQLPLGKGWWLDTLVNPDGIDPQGSELARLQERLLTHGDGLLALKQKRKQRLDAYCQERIAAGLAVPDPQGQELLPEGKEHVIVTTHTPQEPSRFWRVDVGPGDDAALDQCDRQIASAWCEAVLDLRQRFAALKR